MKKQEEEKLYEQKKCGRKRSRMRLCQENVLDEMQEQKLLHIEKNSFWFLYGMLFVAVIIQVSMGGRLREAGAEMICFMAVSVFMVFSCLRQGIWDRRLRADWKTNLKVSCISAFTVALCNFLGIPRRNLSTKMFIGVTIMCVVITFTVTFAVLGICSHFYRKRKEALEDGEEEL